MCVFAFCFVFYGAEYLLTFLFTWVAGSPIILLGRECQELATALLPILDGRTDKTGSEHSRFFLTLENQVLMELKNDILKLLLTVFEMRGSTRIDCLLQMVYRGARDGKALPAHELFCLLSGKEMKSTDASGFADSWLSNGANDSEQLDASRQANDMMVDSTDSEFSNPLAQLPVFDVEVKQIEANKRKKWNKGNNKKANEKPSATKELVSVINDEIMTIRVFDQSETASTTDLIDILLDCLRYESLDLGFTGFDVLIFYVSQAFVFSRTLAEVVTLESDAEAKRFLETQHLVSKFRQCQKWVHQAEGCLECEAIVDSISLNVGARWKDGVWINPDTAGQVRFLSDWFVRVLANRNLRRIFCAI